MLNVPGKIGMMVNDNDAYFDYQAESSYKNKRAKLLKFIKLQQ
jgi:hypothetical protein